MAALATYGDDPTAFATVSTALDDAEVAGLNIDVDLFSYTACDLDGVCGSAAVSIYYAPNLIRLPPDAIDDAATTSTNSSLVIEVLDNDSDRDGVLDPESVVVVSDSSLGTTEVVGGAVVYQAGGSAGLETLAYEVCDTDGRCSTASISVTVESVNPGPTADCNGLVPTIVGTNGDDVLQGTFRDDVIVGLGGDDVIRGGSGSDVICGGDGDDVIDGESQDDTIFGGAGNDQIRGSSGNDTIDGGDGNDVLEGNSQNDIIHGGDGDDDINGGSDNDTLDGGNGIDVLDGLWQTDTCTGGEVLLRCETVLN